VTRNGRMCKGRPPLLSAPARLSQLLAAGPAASHGSNDDSSSGAGSGHGAGPCSAGCGNSSAAEEEDSHAHHPGLVPLGSIAGGLVHDIDIGMDLGLGLDMGPELGMLGAGEDQFCMDPIAAEPWVLTACTSSHPLSHHCPGATNIELLEDLEEGVAAGGGGAIAAAAAPAPEALAPPVPLRPVAVPQGHVPVMSAPQSPGTARSMPQHHQPHQQQHIPYGTAARRSSGSNQHQAQRPRVPPLMAPQPSRVMHTPFITVGGARSEPVASAPVVAHPAAWAGGNASPDTEVSETAELSHAELPGSPSWGSHNASCRKTSSGRVIRPARSVPNFGSMGGPGVVGASPRASSMVPDLMAPAPKRQAPLRRSPSEGYELPRARLNTTHSVPPGPVSHTSAVVPVIMAPAMRSHGSAGSLSMVSPVDVGYGLPESGLMPGDLGSVHCDEGLGGLGDLDGHGWPDFAAPEPPMEPPMHHPLPHFPNGPVIPPEAQPALAALAAMLPPRNNRKRAAGGHGSTCARPAPHPHGHGCTACGTQTTPVWRAGPAGPKTLCNACGVRYMKVARGGGLPPPKK